MSNTAPLVVLSDFSMDEKTVNIHPNDGFDLGLMTTEYVVQIHVGPEHDPSTLTDSDYVYGKVYLKNEVRNGYLELSRKNTEKLTGAKKAVLHHFQGDRYGKLLIIPA